jgi:transposase InsO family protein
MFTSMWYTKESISVEDQVEFECALQQGNMSNSINALSLWSKDTNCHDLPYQFADDMYKLSSRYEPPDATSSPIENIMNIEVLEVSEEPAPSSSNNEIDVNQPSSTESSSSTTTTTSTNNNILTTEEKQQLYLQMRGTKVPASDEEKHTIIEKAHLFGHHGVKAVVRAIEDQNYWWKGMRDDVEKYVHSCTACLRHSIVKDRFHHHQPVVATGPNQHWIIDCMKMTKSHHGYEWCLVIIDVFTGYVMLKPLMDQRATSIAKALWEVICILGPPKIIQSDNGTEFVNQVISALYSLMGVERRLISAYNPRADGKVERSIRSVRTIMNKCIKGAHIYWPDYLPFVQLAINARLSSLTGSSPFSLMMCRPLNEFKDYTEEQITTVKLEDEKMWKQYIEKYIHSYIP